MKKALIVSAIALAVIGFTGCADKDGMDGAKKCGASKCGATKKCGDSKCK